MASQSGVQTFDFLRGDEPYKYRFGAVDTFDRSYLLARGLLGSCVRARTRQLRRPRTGIQAVESEQRANRSPSRCASVNRSNRLTTRGERRSTTSTREFTIVEQSLDRVSQRARVIRFDEHPGLDGHELRYTGESCRHDRHARGHRFHEGNGDPLHPAGRVADRGEHEHVGPPELGRNLF